jgi:cephalosporin hydroxylase
MPTWADDVHVILGDSHSAEIVQQVYSLLDGDKLDFLFIDGDHTYEGVKKDYLVYRRCVRSGGWIGFHDINDTTLHRDHHCLVAKLWSELEGKKIAMTIGDEWGGIGVVQVP